MSVVHVWRVTPAMRRYVRKRGDGQAAMLEQVGPALNVRAPQRVGDVCEGGHQEGEGDLQR